MPHALARLTAVLLLLGASQAVCAQPALPGPDPDPGPGPGPLAIRDSGEFLIHDESREKDLPIRVRAPEPTDEAPGPFPCIIFSHGMGGDSSVFPALSNTLASHGFVVIAPTHADSIRLRRQQAKDKTERRSIRLATTRVDLEDRVADVSFILDSFDAIEHTLGTPGLIDREKLGMAGHSAGAMTTQAIAGLRFFAWGLGKGRTMTDPRLDAFAVISGQGTTRRSITEDSWNGIDKPWLVITGSKDQIALSKETPASRRHPYEYAPADGTKYLVFIEGATHSSYQGRGFGTLLDGGAPDNIEEIVEITNKSVLAFFEAYLKNDETAKARLDSGALFPHEDSTVEFLHK